MRWISASTVVVVDQVGLADEDLVGKADLAARLLAVVELLVGVLGVDQGQDRVEQVALGDLVVHEEGLRHRAGVGQAGGLDHDAVEVELALALLLGQVGQGGAQVFADRAADAAVVQLDDLLLACPGTRISLSMFSSPNSFSITAIFWPCASVSTRLSSVVLPEPRKPVRMVAGIRLMDGSPWVGIGAAAAPREASGQMGPASPVQGSRLVKRARLAASGKLAPAPTFRRPPAALTPMSEPPADPRRARRRQGRRRAPNKRNLFQKLVDLVAPGPDSRDQLIESLADAEHKELIEPESRMMLEGVIRMADMTAGDVMVPTPRMDLLDIDAPYDELLHVVIDTGHSRFPVYEGERDNVIGILMAKDLLKLQRSPDLNLRTLLRPAVFVPESKGLNDLLRDFRSNRNHLAIVIDEFGSTAGLHHDRGRARGDRRRDRGRVRRARTASRASTRWPTAASASPATPRSPRSTRSFDVAAADRRVRHHRRPGRARARPRAAARRDGRRSAGWSSR